MNIADKATANALQFECKKDGLKQLQSGEWTLSLKVHASDVPPALLVAAMGTRYQAVIVEIGDDEQPVVQKPENKHRLSQQAAILCNEPAFRTFLARDCSDIHMFDICMAEDAVRDFCVVMSRSEFDTNAEAAARWRDLKAEYEAWKLL